ncbi:dihydrofolate reductase family protein [Halostreptopolyspora alba]|uniref:Dihydrofolate reductase n=1 Tax=Halostreptopolyspora alba TaxID=2487137 RepID=A0A3N0E6Z8_9ACTN|nr:dihydrofolate reductase [Nocardiopsaceae bacterium YIM 96095]
MRDLVVTENITIDGVIDGTGGWFSPANVSPETMADVNSALAEQSAAADAVVFGRVTFEEMRGYWPGRQDDTSGVSRYLDTVAKYVFSSTLDDPRWEHTTVLRGDVDTEIRALKTLSGKDIVATGSIRLVHSLIAAGVVDEYRLFVHPVVRGHGAQLFVEGTRIPQLRLVESRPFRSGVVLLRYRIDLA